jgi:hypothetical protein
MTTSIRMPVTVAGRKGVSAVAAEAAEHRVVLTSHGRPVAVVDAPERVDEDLRKVREAARLVVERFADVSLATRPAKLDIADVCERLGVDPELVLRRAAQLSGR